MSTRSTQMHLFVNYNLGGGNNVDHWQRSEDPAAFLDINHYVAIARASEEAGVDAVFLPDATMLREDVPETPWQVLDPLTALAVIAANTERIGLIGTASTTLNLPYDLARRLASLDHMSKGRVAWNIVTTAAEAATHLYGFDLPDHDERYGRAAEFVRLAKQLWDSWEDGGLVLDKQTGQMVDPTKLHTVEHQGRWYAASGRFQVPRMPQGYPVLVQAGASKQGIEFAGEVAEVAFIVHPQQAGARKAYDNLKAAAVRQGRRLEEMRVMAGVVPIVGDTPEDAEAKRVDLESHVSIEAALDTFARSVGQIFTLEDLDKPVPGRPGELDYVHGSRGFTEAAWEWAESYPGLTLRELLLRRQPRVGLPQIVGTAVQVADTLEEWFTSGAADGFMISFSHFPGGLMPFLDQVLPILRERGLFRDKYEASTLRGHLGLETPTNQFSARTQERP